MENIPIENNPKMQEYLGETYEVKVDEAGREYIWFERGDHAGKVFMDQINRVKEGAAETNKAINASYQKEYTPPSEKKVTIGTKLKRELKQILSSFPNPLQGLFTKKAKAETVQAQPIAQSEKPREPIDRDLEELFRVVDECKSDRDKFEAVKKCFPRLQRRSLNNQALAEKFNNLIQTLSNSNQLDDMQKGALDGMGILTR